MSPLARRSSRRATPTATHCKAEYGLPGPNSMSYWPGRGLRAGPLCRYPLSGRSIAKLLIWPARWSGGAEQVLHTELRGMTLLTMAISLPIAKPARVDQGLAGVLYTGHAYPEGDAHCKAPNTACPVWGRAGVFASGWHFCISRRTQITAFSSLYA